MKKYLAMLLAALMVLTALLGMVACTEEPNDGPGSTDGGTTDDGTTDDGSGETENGRLPIDYLPTEPYGSADKPAQYNMLQWTTAGGSETGSNWVPWEEGNVTTMDGDKLGEAVYTRNRAVEERYNVEITAEYAAVEVAPTHTYLVDTNHTSGDDAYQLITTRALALSTFVLNEYLLDMNDYSQYIHTDMPWWVPDSVTSYTLGDHLYAACSELLLRDKGATAALYFNQQIAADNGIDYLFDYVRDHRWTVEEMIKTAEIVSHDADGNDMMDSAQDVWGMICGDDAIYYLYNSFGYKYAHIDEDGLLTIDFGTEDTITAIQDICEDVMFADWYLNSFTTGTTIQPSDTDLFSNGQVMFAAGMVKHTITKYKNMEDLYGILPFPMQDEDQEGYSSLVWMHHDSTLGIPSAVKDADMCAVILEALSYEAYYTVSPVFYDAILLNRAAKDEDSKQMLQIILDTRSYDPGQYWDGAPASTATTASCVSLPGIARLTSPAFGPPLGIRWWTTFKRSTTSSQDDRAELHIQMFCGGDAEIAASPPFDRSRPFCILSYIFCNLSYFLKMLL